MEIAIKDNKRNWQIVKDNRRFLFPPKIIDKCAYASI